jgi:hypothetical protein
MQGTQTISVKNIPSELWNQLKAEAVLANRSIPSFLTELITKALYERKKEKRCQK